MSYFEGKTVLVTGAATGVGEGVAQRLYQAGATVFISGRQLEQVKKTAYTIDPTGEKVIALQADMTSPEQVKSMFETILAQTGALHGLVNNAGITGPHNTSIVDYNIDDWKAVMDTDINGVFYGLKYGIPALLRSGGGSIVNLSCRYCRNFCLYCSQTCCVRDHPFSCLGICTARYTCECNRAWVCRHTANATVTG